MANNPQNNEEVDLGSLFVIIGKGFSNFFNFIGNFFKDVFHLLIIFLLFLKEHLVKIAIASVFGFIVGFIIEIVTPKRYTSDLLLHPNYKSARQLYNNINFYNDLVKQKDTLRIQKTFGLDKEDAASLKEFIIYPIRNQSDIISRYYDLTLELDTLTLRSYNFEEFKNSFTDFTVSLGDYSSKYNVFCLLSEPENRSKRSRIVSYIREVPATEIAGNTIGLLLIVILWYYDNLTYISGG